MRSLSMIFSHSRNSRLRKDRASWNNRQSFMCGAKESDPERLLEASEASPLRAGRAVVEEAVFSANVRQIAVNSIISPESEVGLNY